MKLEKEDGYSNPVDATYYQSLVGSLLYAAMATRPDIVHAAGMLGRYNSAPNKAHLTAAKRVCRYLKGTIDIKLVYTETVCEAVGYSDADWASSVNDRHSTSGNVMLIAGGAVSWLSKRQATVALSTAEAEYVSLTTMIQEAIWIQDYCSVLERKTTRSQCLKTTKERLRWRKIQLCILVRSILTSDIISYGKP